MNPRFYCYYFITLCLIYLKSTSVYADSANIKFSHEPVYVHSNQEDLTIAGTMQGFQDVEKSIIFFHLDNSPVWQQQELELKENDVYFTVIAGSFLTGQILEYYIVAYDFLGKEHFAFAQKDAAHRVVLKNTQKMTNTEDSPPKNNTVLSVNLDKNKTTGSDNKAKTLESILENTGASPYIYTFRAQDLLELGVHYVIDVIHIIHRTTLTRNINGQYQLNRMGMKDNPSVAVFLDGQPMNQLFYGDFDLRFSVALLDRVVIKFEGGHAIDNHAPIAVVELTTAQKSPFFARFLVGGYLSHFHHSDSPQKGNYDLSMMGGYQKSNFSITAHGQVIFSEGAQIKISDNDKTLDNQLVTRFGVVISRQLPKQHQLHIFADHLFQKFDNYMGAFDLIAPQGGTTQHQLRLLGRLKGQPRENISYEINLGYRYNNLQQNRLLAPLGYETTDKNNDGQKEIFSQGVIESLNPQDNVLFMSGRLDAQLASINRFLARVDFTQMIGTDPMLMRNINNTGILMGRVDTYDIAKLSPYLQNRSLIQMAIENRLVPKSFIEIDLGIRLSASSDIPVSPAQLFMVFNPIASLKFFPLPEIEINLFYDSSARPANIDERYERSLYDYHGAMANSKLTYMLARTSGVSFSYSRTTLPIKYIGALQAVYRGTEGYPVADYDNNQNLRLMPTLTTHGLEMNGHFKLQFMRRSFFNIGMTWFKNFATVNSNGMSNTSLLTETPQISASMQIVIELGRFFDVRLTAILYSSRRSNILTQEQRQININIPTKGFVALSLRTQPLFFGTRLQISGQNLFDQAYYDIPGTSYRLPAQIPREGFKVMAGFEFDVDNLQKTSMSAPNKTQLNN